MPKFLSELDMELIRDDRIWRLKSPLRFRSDVLGGVAEAPAGFETDLSSVPRVPIIYMLYGGRAHREGVIHDLLYRIDAADFIKFDDGIQRTNVSFSTANKVFFEAMECRGKSLAVRYGMTAGVYIGGWFSYQKRLVMDRL